MYVIVVGAELEGQRLIEIAADEGHEVALIEQDKEKIRLVLKRRSIRALNGDIAEDSILQEVEVARADVIVAATYDDSKNLMAMMLAQEHDVKVRISLLNNDSHRQIFEKLGVTVISDPAKIVARQMFEHFS